MKNFAEYKHAKTYQLAIRIAITTMCVLGILSLAHIEESVENTIVFASGFVLCGIVLSYVLVSKKSKLIYYLVCSLGIILPGIGLLFLNEVTHYTDIVWMMDAIMLAFLGIGYRFGVFMAICSTLITLYFSFFHANTHIESVLILDGLKKLALVAETTASLGLGTYTLILILDFYSRSEMELQKNNDTLLEKNYQIQIQRDEKILLIKEIHHRVKNNLQIVTSLLRMQSQEIKNEESKKHFSEAINRILAMSLIHEKLYQKDTLANIKLTNYIDDLANDLINIYDKENSIFVQITCDIEYIGLKSIVPLGLLINELITNSLEHAFEKVNEGKIEILISESKDSDYFKFSYSDSGEWKEEKEMKENSGFGLELINMLTDQLDGTKEFLNSEQGTSYLFSLKNLDE